MNGKGARYTRMHKPLKLAYVERFNSRPEAMREERKIKRLNHLQKLEMINSKIQRGNFRGEKEELV